MDVTVAILSLWRNDAERMLDFRISHLLSKQSSLAALRWVWVVGDSTDGTEDVLRQRAAQSGLDVTVIRHDTNLVGEVYGPSPNPQARMLRGCATFNAALDAVNAGDTYAMLHESDLHSPIDLVDQFVGSGLCPVAGWPILPIEVPPLFYDTWGYRGLDGERFSNYPPYHRDYRNDKPFIVGSVGSCFMMSAADVRSGVRCSLMGVVEICEQLRGLGRSISVLPNVVIVQPVNLWTPSVGL